MKTHNNTNRVLASALLSGVVGILATPNYTLAQNRLIEEVVVTAQKREENSQDVPITMAAISGEKLEAYGIEDTADLQKITPGLTFTEQYGYTIIYLRGIGSEAFLPNAEPSIATYIDGINIAGAHGKQDSVGPVERIEVLKGPQGTLYGRSATGGALNIVSKAVPDEGYTGSISYKQGNYDSRAVQAYVGAAITDYAGFTFAYYKDSHDNYGGRTSEGDFQKPEKEDFSESFRLKLRARFGENITVTAIGQKSDQRIVDSLRNENIKPGGLALGEPADPADRVASNNIEGNVRSDSDLVALIFDWALGPVDIKFIYSDQNSLGFDNTQTDYDGTDEQRTSFHTYDEPTFQTTYELQIASNEDTWMGDKLRWLAGLYHLEGGGGFDRIFFHVSPTIATGLVTAGLPPLISNAISDVLNNEKIILESGGNITIESDSVFAEANYAFTDSINMTMGVRYQEETRGLVRNYLELVDTTGGEPPESYYDSDDHSRNTRLGTFIVPDLKDDSLAPRLALQWFPNEDIQVYTSWARGFKSQTYNILNFFSAPDAVEKSTTTSVELGVKSDLFDGTLRLNGAVFKTVTKNPISSVVALTSGGVVSFFNAGESEVEGAEMDFLWQPMPNWNPGLAISGGASYIQAVYTDFQDGSGYDEDSGLFYGPDALTAQPARDFTGNDIPRTPKFSSNVSINQFITMGDFGDFEIGVDYAFKDSFFLSASNNPGTLQPQYELWSARATWSYEPWGVALTGFVNNAKDEMYFSQLIENDYGIQGNFGAPKLYGVKLKVQF